MSLKELGIAMGIVAGLIFISSFFNLIRQETSRTKYFQAEKQNDEIEMEKQALKFRGSIKFVLYTTIVSVIMTLISGGWAIGELIASGGTDPSAWGALLISGIGAYWGYRVIVACDETLKMTHDSEVKK